MLRANPLLAKIMCSQLQLEERFPVGRARSRSNGDNQEWGDGSSAKRHH
jgi:hypothetical protein